MNNENSFMSFLKKILILNVFFILLMTFLSFIFFLSYETYLWENLPKFDIFKVFAQNLRFNLSAAAYANIPIFICFAVLLAFDTPIISRVVVSAVKLYYIVIFILLFFLQMFASFSSHIFTNFKSFHDMDYIANFATIFLSFDDNALLTMIIPITMILLSTVILFGFTIKFILKSKEIEVFDRRKSLITVLITLLLLIIFARGGILKHLSYEDSHVTPSTDLNKYALNGAYQTAKSVKYYNRKNIKHLMGTSVDIGAMTAGDFSQFEGMDLPADLDSLDVSLANARKIEKEVNKQAR